MFNGLCQNIWQASWKNVSVPSFPRKYIADLCRQNATWKKRKGFTLTRSRGVCPSLFFFVASAPCLSSNFTISYLPWNEIEFSEAKRRRWSNLGSSFVQRGEFPEVGHIHSGPVLHQQLGDLDRIVLVCFKWLLSSILLNCCYVKVTSLREIGTLCSRL